MMANATRARPNRIHFRLCQESVWRKSPLPDGTNIVGCSVNSWRLTVKHRIPWDSNMAANRYVPIRCILVFICSVILVTERHGSASPLLSINFLPVHGRRGSSRLLGRCGCIPDNKRRLPGYQGVVGPEILGEVFLERSPCCWAKPSVDGPTS